MGRGGGARRGRPPNPPLTLVPLYFVGHVAVRALSVDRAHLRGAVPLLPVAEARSRRVRRPRVSPAHRSVQLDLHWKTNEEISGTHITVTGLIFNFQKMFHFKFGHGH